MTKPIGVIGAGAWGTALAQAIGLGEKNVLLWAKESSVRKDISKNRQNSEFLPNVNIAETVEVTNNLEDLTSNCDVIFIVCPANYYTEVFSSVNHKITDNHQLIICSKGLREVDGSLLSDVLDEVIQASPKIGVLSGPGFATDLAAEKACMLTISSKSQSLIHNVNNILSIPSIRIYHNDDIIGAQIGAALKNVIAIAAGIAHEMGLGESIQAGIVCRGLKEVERYCEAFGGKKETIYGLAGLGDVLLTTTSERSRNYRFGKNIGQGLTTKEALEVSGGYVEGIKTARIVTIKALSQGIDLALISAIDGILYGDVSAEKVIKFLLKRPRAHEWE